MVGLIAAIKERELSGSDNGSFVTVSAWEHMLTALPVFLYESSSEEMHPNDRITPAIAVQPFVTSVVIYPSRTWKNK